MVIRVISNIVIPLFCDLLLVYHFYRKKAIIFSRIRETLKKGVTAMEKEKREKIVTDSNGSYTGCPADPDERPVQDADDL